ncbi:Uncharacterized protein FKW44_011020, partial [Caligus rogercresseyi]
WIRYSSHGERIPGTPFIAFKTPLSQKFFGNETLKYPNDPPHYGNWTPNALLERIPELGTVIDLTATNKYYGSSSLKHVGHFKIYVQGRVVPPEKIVE